MKTRKLVLVIADVVLLVLLALQLIMKAGDKVKTFDLKEEPDEISITTPAESFTFVKENDDWFVGEKKYGTNGSYVKSVVDALKSVKVLDKVGVANSEVNINRYELNEGKNILVVAKKDGKIIRTLNIGKQSTAGAQAYITVDEGKDIYLSNGGLRDAFDKSLSYFRTRVVYSVEKTDISSVMIKPENGTSFTISRNGAGENLAWAINVPDTVVDSSAATEWFNSLATIITPVWHDDCELSGNKLCDAEIASGSKTVSFTIYEIPAATEDEKSMYFGVSSELPYQFELANYQVQKFQKTVEDLVQKN